MTEAELDGSARLLRKASAGGKMHAEDCWETESSPLTAVSLRHTHEHDAAEMPSLGAMSELAAALRGIQHAASMDERT